MLRRIQVTQDHIDRSARMIRIAHNHPIALAINEILKLGLVASATASHFAISCNTPLEVLVNGNLPASSWDFNANRVPFEFSLDLSEQFTVPETELGFYKLRGCSRTDAVPESFTMNSNFDNIDDRNDFYRLVFAMRKFGVDVNAVIGLGKLFFDLGSGKKMFANPDPPEGYRPMIEVVKHEPV